MCPEIHTAWIGKAEVGTRIREDVRTRGLALRRYYLRMSMEKIVVDELS